LYLSERRLLVYRIIALVVVAVTLVSISVSCSMPRSPITFALYQDVKDGLAVNPGDIPDAPKVGESTSTSVIGITTGDSSIDAARRQGNLKKIYYADYHSFSILGIYGKTTTKVYGD
jgi:hypothetical protein